MQGTDGSFYGTTQVGGNDQDFGTIFKITPSGALTTLDDFSGPQGYSPITGLVQASNGNFYGTTYEATNNTYGQSGQIYEITPAGVLTVIYGFCRQLHCPTGETPTGNLIVGIDGLLYGTTEEGGLNTLGTVFKVTLGGKLTSVYSFCGPDFCSHGNQPEGSLVQGANGNFFGSTFAGGTMVCYLGCGTIFKLTPSGEQTTLHRFHFTDGMVPNGGLIENADGDFYGTAKAGGAFNLGTVFKVTPGGAFHFVVHLRCVSGR